MRELLRTCKLCIYLCLPQLLVIKHTMLSERGQVQEAAYCMAPLIAAVQKAFQWFLSYKGRK